MRGVGRIADVGDRGTSFFPFFFLRRCLYFSCTRFPYNKTGGPGSVGVFRPLRGKGALVPPKPMWGGNAQFRCRFFYGKSAIRNPRNHLHFPAPAAAPPQKANRPIESAVRDTCPARWPFDAPCTRPESPDEVRRLPPARHPFLGPRWAGLICRSPWPGPPFGLVA